jgi:CheY-like chemotaxis protein
MTTSLPPLLIVEDSDEDFEAFKRFIKRSSQSIPLRRCTNGEQALAFLRQIGHSDRGEKEPYPSLIVLDLNLPGTDGREVLRQIKQDRTLQQIPIVIFTTSDHPKDREDCFQFGIMRYMVKPINIEQLKRDIQTIIDYWRQFTPLSHG